MGKQKARGQEPQKPAPCSLSYREERFIEEYIRTGNATQSAITAGYSRVGARVQGHRMLTRANISDAVDSAREASREKAKVKRDDLIEKLIIIALGDPGDVVSWGPKGIKMKDYRRAGPSRHMVESISASSSMNGGSSSLNIKFRDKIKAIDELWTKLGFQNAESGRDREAYVDAIRNALERVRK